MYGKSGFVVVVIVADDKTGRACVCTLQQALLLSKSYPLPCILCILSKVKSSRASQVTLWYTDVE